MSKKSIQDKEKDFNNGMDRERMAYIEKYREESRKNTVLQTQGEQKDMKIRDLSVENEELKAKIKIIE